MPRRLSADYEVDFNAEGPGASRAHKGHSHLPHIYSASPSSWYINLPPPARSGLKKTVYSASMASLWITVVFLIGFYKALDIPVDETIWWVAEAAAAGAEMFAGKTVEEIRQLSFDYKPRFGVSPYRGVTRTGYLKPDGAQRWCARIFIDGKMKQLSADYATQEDAARAYDAKAVEIGRPRHQLNFPDEH